ncbi:MAG TPA: type II toxin-antitoxin system VapC family toxin [Solirubrobacterales bacterium]
MPVFYADASALVKLAREEAESASLNAYLAGADLVSSELALAEVPRALRRAVAMDPALPLEGLWGRVDELIHRIALRPIDHNVLLGAAALTEPSLRTLDAIHVTTALHLSPVEAFVTYDQRQAAAARLAGLRTVAPGT